MYDSFSILSNSFVVERRVKAMRSQMKAMCSTIHHSFNLEILKLPSHIRDMKMSELFGEFIVLFFQSFI